MSDLQILRRIAERGLAKAQQERSEYVDLFQHLLDEIQRVGPCPSCAEKDAKIERLRTEFSDLMKEFREIGLEEVPNAIQRILRGEASDGL